MHQRKLLRNILKIKVNFSSTSPKGKGFPKLNYLYDTEEIERLFSNLKEDRGKIISGIEKVLNELTKILVLHDTCNSNLKHWIDELVGFMMEGSTKGLSPVLMFLPLYESGVFPKGFDKESILIEFRGKLSGTNKDLIEGRIKYMIK